MRNGEGFGSRKKVDYLQPLSSGPGFDALH